MTFFPYNFYIFKKVKMYMLFSALTVCKKKDEEKVVKRALMNI